MTALPIPLICERLRVALIGGHRARDMGVDVI